MNVATHIMDRGAGRALYRMDPPLDGAEYVVLSGVNNGWAHEVMAFAANETGEVQDYLDLACVKGTTSHSVLLAEIDYATA